MRGELTTTPESGYLAIGKDSRSWGRSEVFVSFHDFSPCKLRTDVELRDGRPDIDRAELERAIEAPWDTARTSTTMRPPERWRREAVGDQHEGDRALRPDVLWQRRAEQYRAVVDLLRQARSKVPPGSRAEASSTRSAAASAAPASGLRDLQDRELRRLLRLLVLQAWSCEEAKSWIELDRTWLARLDGDEAAAGDRLDQDRDLRRLLRRAAAPRWSVPTAAHAAWPDR